MSTTDRYEANGEWSGLTAWRAPKGWIIEKWTAVQGDRTGGRYLIPYDLIDLDEPLDNDDLIALWAIIDQGKRLRMGILVQ